MLFVAAIEPSMSGITVYFKVWDVDDPFDQNNPDMPDVQLIDGNTTGPDNRIIGGGGDPAVGTYTETTGESGDYLGKARVTLEVSMQPGNNYRAGASVLQDATGPATQATADALNQQGGDFSGYSVPLTWSKMLTVWRKLTIEVDSMDRESQEFGDRYDAGWEWDHCVVTSAQEGMPGPGFSTVQCAYDPGHGAGYPGDNFYEGGAFVRPDTGEEFLIVRSTPVDGNRLTVWQGPGADVAGLECTLRDDDPFFSPAEAPRQLPKTTVLDQNITTAYRHAYIQVVEASPSLNPGNIVAWTSNLDALTLELHYMSQQGISGEWSLGSSDSFWVRHLVICYQPGASVDGDGDEHENCAISQNCQAVYAPYPILGLPSLPQMDQRFGATVRNEMVYDTALSTVYIETIRDQTTDDTSPKFWQFVGHEVGHATLDQDGNMSAPGAEHLEGGLMTGAPEGPQLQDIPHLRVFTAPTLVRFRESRRW